MRIIIFILLLTIKLIAQTNIEFYLENAYKNNVDLKNIKNRNEQNDLQLNIDKSENEGTKIYLTGNYLISPYFDEGKLKITQNPTTNAIGYDIGITNGGLYSALINVEKRILTPSIFDVFNNKNRIQKAIINYDSLTAKREVTKQVIELYIQSYFAYKLYLNSKKIEDILNSQYQTLVSMLNNGAVNSTDILLFLIEIKNQNILGSKYLLDYRINLLSLNNVCGISDTSSVILDSLNNYNFYDRYNFSDKYSLDSLNYENLQELYELKYKPQFTVFLNSGLNALEINNIQRKFGLSAGLNLQIPLYDGNQKEITKQQTIIQLKAINEYKLNFEKFLIYQRQISELKVENLEKSLTNCKSQLQDYENIINQSFNSLFHGNISATEYFTLLKNYCLINEQLIVAKKDYDIEKSKLSYWEKQ